MEQEIRTGLVLEGGAMRGIYTAGVLDVFLENGLHFDGVMGVSAGALHGCSYVSGQKGRSIRYFKKYRSDWRFMSFRCLIQTGDLVGNQFCYHDIPERLDPFDYEAFSKSGTDFYVCCTNLETGKAEYYQITDMLGQIDLVRASASMPYVSRPVHYKNKKLLDGGCADGIPVSAFHRMGYPVLVAVLTREEGYVKEPEDTKMAQLFYGRYPEFVHALSRRFLVYNRTVLHIEELESQGKIFVIRPSQELKIDRMEEDLSVIQNVYDIGRKDAENQIGDLKDWLSRKVSHLQAVKP